LLTKAPSLVCLLSIILNTLGVNKCNNIYKIL
jgi:hypothetical protein